MIVFHSKLPISLAIQRRGTAPEGGVSTLEWEMCPPIPTVLCLIWLTTAYLPQIAPGTYLFTNLNGKADHLGGLVNGCLG